MLLWEPADPAAAAAQRGNLAEDEGEASWRRAAALKGHGREGDVMDLCWAPDGSALATASIDSEVMLWATDGRRAAKQAGRLVNHKHFVQGVAWDPAQQYVVTQSADRTCRCVGQAGGERRRRRTWGWPSMQGGRLRPGCFALPGHKGASQGCRTCLVLLAAPSTRH